MEKYGSRINFALLYTMFLMHVLHMLKFFTFPSVLQCLFYSLACLHVGSTRSLSFYTLNRDSSPSSLNPSNSLLTLTNALSIPIIATVSLIGAYLAAIN